MLPEENIYECWVERKGIGIAVLILETPRNAVHAMDGSDGGVSWVKIGGHWSVHGRSIPETAFYQKKQIRPVLNLLSNLKILFNISVGPHELI